MVSAPLHTVDTCYHVIAMDQTTSEAGDNKELTFGSDPSMRADLRLLLPVCHFSDPLLILSKGGDRMTAALPDVG